MTAVITLAAHCCSSLTSLVVAVSVIGYPVLLALGLHVAWAPINSVDTFEHDMGEFQPPQSPAREQSGEEKQITLGGEVI